MHARASKEDEVESIRKLISDFLSKYGETRINDILGITIISINTSEEKKNCKKKKN